MSFLTSLYNNLKEKNDKDFFRIDLPHKEINDCTWLNHIYSSPSIRYGHLEYFKSNNDAIEVVHSVFFPSYYKALPIFGFDVVGLDFLDLLSYLFYQRQKQRQYHLDQNF